MKSNKSGTGSRGLEEAKKAFSADWKMLDEYAMLLHQQDSVNQKKGISDIEIENTS